MKRYIVYGDLLDDAKDLRHKYRNKQILSFYELDTGVTIALSHCQLIDNKTERIEESEYILSYANEYYEFGGKIDGWLFSPETALGSRHPTDMEKNIVVNFFEKHVRDNKNLITNVEYQC